MLLVRRASYFKKNLTLRGNRLIFIMVETLQGQLIGLYAYKLIGIYNSLLIDHLQLKLIR
jgi:hypothetical protein